MIRQRNRSKSLRFESSSWGIIIFPSRMFVTNACHPSLKICSLNDRFTGLLMQQVFFFPTYFPTFFYSYRYKMQIKGAMNLLSVQRKGRSTFRKRFSNADIQRYMKIVHILDHWSMEITRKWDGHIYKYNLSLTATEKWQYHWVQWNRPRL